MSAVYSRSDSSSAAYFVQNAPPDTSAHDPTLNVLHLSHTSQPGGAELALARLLSQDRDWTAGICAPPGEAFDSLVQYGVELDKSLPTLPTGGTQRTSPVLAARYLSSLYACARQLRRITLLHKPHLVHANTAAAAIFCALAKRHNPKPLVVHLRDMINHESLGRLGLAAFTHMGLRAADGVISNSSSTLRSAEHLLPSKVARAVIQSPIGLTERATKPILRTEVRAVGIAGRLQSWKGQHIFLQAFARSFRDTGILAYIAGAPLFGTAPYERELRQLAADLEIADQVIFLGHVKDFPKFLESIDILVHASTKAEPLGQTVLQGLANGLPVIATEGGGPGEWIRSGENGFLVPPDQPDALAMALRMLADSPELRARFATAAVKTKGILTDKECMAAHGEFFQTVWAAHRARAWE